MGLLPFCGDGKEGVIGAVAEGADDEAGGGMGEHIRGGKGRVFLGRSGGVEVEKLGLHGGTRQDVSAVDNARGAVEGGAAIDMARGVAPCACIAGDGDADMGAGSGECTLRHLAGDGFADGFVSFEVGAADAEHVGFGVVVIDGLAAGEHFMGGIEAADEMSDGTGGERLGGGDGDVVVLRFGDEGFGAGDKVTAVAVRLRLRWKSLTA